jgi:transposase-like protein
MKLSFTQLWILISCWQKKYSLETACEMAEVSIPTARRWFRRFQYHLPYEPSSLLVREVEIDEAFVGKRRTGNQRLVIGAYERRTGKVRLQTSTNRSQETTDLFILKHVKLGSVVYTDSFSSYEGIDSFFGYRHIVCNHSEYVFGPTNHIEAIWSSLKRYIRRTWQQIRAYLLPYFIKEFEARINEPELFEEPSTYLKRSLVCSISFT